jgi:RNA polymerase sigma factor (sigma-70 family)
MEVMTVETETIEVSNDCQYQSGEFWARSFEDSDGKLLSYANKLTNRMVFDAEDLVQETLYRVLCHARQPNAIKNPTAYLRRTMKNIWIDRWKKENRANVESLEFLKSREDVVSKYHVVPGVLDVLERNELKREFYCRQGHLTVREKTLLDLHLQGNTCQDIADSLREDVSATRIALNAVKNKIRYRVRFRTQKGMDVAPFSNPRGVKEPRVVVQKAS